MKRNTKAWKPVGGPDGKYAGLLVVTLGGKLKLLERPVKVCGGGHRIIPEKILKSSTLKNGSSVAVIPELVVNGFKHASQRVPLSVLIYDAHVDPGAIERDPNMSISFVDGNDKNLKLKNLTSGTVTIEDLNWRPITIAGYGDDYQVSRSGEVRSLSRAKTSGIRILKRGYNKGGESPVIRLPKRAQRTSSFPIRLDFITADAWLKRPGNTPPNELALLHLDEDPENCSVKNLQWADNAFLRKYERLPKLKRGEILKPAVTSCTHVNENYFVSNRGRVWPRRRISEVYNSNQIVPASVSGGKGWVSTNLEKDGYEYISISVPRQKPKFYSHMQGIVGQTFIGLRTDDKPHFDHLDCNKLNNRSDNLELVSVRENNTRRSLKHALHTLLSSPEGIQVKLHGVARYARHLNLENSNLAKLIAGHTQGVFGWTLWSSKHRQPILRKDVSSAPGDWRIPNIDPAQFMVERYRINPLGEVLNAETGEVKYGSLTSAKRNKQPYRTVSLKLRDGKYKNFIVHRLVALTFIKNPGNKSIVDHINRDALDNRAENLRWATYKENNQNIIVKRLNRIFRNPKGRYIILRDRDFNLHFAKLKLDPNSMKAVYQGEIAEIAGWRRPTNSELRAFYNSL